MKIKFTLILLACVISHTYCIAQKEGNIWYFGNKAGVDFNQETPTALEDSKMNTAEGCATIADAQGKLLFYTDGTTVWDKNHDPMANGQNLKGNSSSTQSAIVVRKPSSVFIYMVFTVDVIGSDGGLRLTEVDMRLNGGLGDVNAVKNNLIENSTCEKVTVISHKNERDHWLISQMYGQNKARFHSYEITSGGVSSLPVFSSLMSNVNLATHAIGYLKGSLDGAKLASANTNKGTVELLNFNNATGEITDLVVLDNFTADKPYGLEFSPDNKYLYVSESSRPAKIYQYDITLGNETLVKNSRIEVAEYNGFLGALQLAPNNKIYIAKYSPSSLAVIEKPNSKGVACDYKENGINLLSGKCLRGLPTFNNSIIEPLSALEIKNKCLGAATSFELTSNIDADSLRWNFGDPSSSSNSSTTASPSHVYSDTGWYYIEAILSYPTLKDTITDSLYISWVPSIDLGEDLELCQGETHTLTILDQGALYTWQDASSGNIYVIQEEGKYKVTAELNGCFATDSVLATYTKMPTIDLGPDTLVCNNEIVIIKPEITNGVLKQWQDGSRPAEFEAKYSGTYWAEAENGICIARDTFNLLYLVFLPDLDLGSDTTFCTGDSIILSIDPINDPIIWSDGSNSTRIVVKEEGLYFVTVNGIDCSASDSIFILENQPPGFNLKKDSILCINKTLELKIECLDGTYLWSDGSSKAILEVTTPGDYWGTATNNCGTLSDTAAVKLKDCTCYLQMAEAFTPNNDNLNETFAPTYISCNFRAYYFSIYNRWGEVVFRTTDQNVRWDGSYLGNPSQLGVYMYNLNYVDQDGVRESKNGVVTLMR